MCENPTKCLSTKPQIKFVELSWPPVIGCSLVPGDVTTFKVQQVVTSSANREQLTNNDNFSIKVCLTVTLPYIT